jgi:proteasome lid subunit RPN8/RPN11
MSRKNRKQKIAATILILMAMLTLSVVVNFLLYKYNIISLNEITLQESKITITQLAQQDLNQIYTEELDREIAACLKGEIKNKKITLTGVEKATTITSNESFVEFELCKTFLGLEKTIGLIHNHPNGNCELSNQDIETYTNLKNYGHSIIAVNCKENNERINVFYLLATLETEIE